MLEILITLFVISLGLVGITGMQLTALQRSQTAYLDSVAATQLQALFERLRANPSSATREQELLRWNSINARLLPKGRGDFQCSAHLCTAHIEWWYKKTYALFLTAYL